MCKNTPVASSYKNPSASPLTVRNIPEFSPASDRSASLPPGEGRARETSGIADQERRGQGFYKARGM